MHSIEVLAFLDQGNTQTRFTFIGLTKSQLSIVAAPVHARASVAVASVAFHW